MSYHIASTPISETFQTRQTQLVTTTDATATVIDSFEIHDEEAYYVEILVVGKKSDGSERCCVKKNALIYRDGAGDATIQGTVGTICSEFSDATWDVDITVSGDDVRAVVTGIASTTIEWISSVQLLEH